MSAPAIWVIIPAVAAILLFLFRRNPFARALSSRPVSDLPATSPLTHDIRWRAMIYTIGIFISLLLAILAWTVPINQSISLGFPGIQPVRISDTLFVFGRQLVIRQQSQPLLTLLYFAISLWFSGAAIAGVRRLFVSAGLGIAAALTAALVVEPILFSAPLIMLAAMISIPILSPPGELIQRAIRRFLSFQLIAMCLILLGDWLLGALVTNPNDLNPLAPSAALIGLGFALAGGIFPFHTWIPMLAQDSHPYPATFTFFMLPLAVIMVGLKYLARYSGYDIYPTLLSTLLYAGVLMTLVGGLWAAFERRLGRILGFAVIVQIGLALIAISLGTQTGQVGSLFFVQLVPQGLALGIWAQALGIFRDHVPERKDLPFFAVKGKAHLIPIASAGLVLANFSLAGLPLLGNFPGQIALWSAASQVSLPIALLSLVGCASLFGAGLRTLVVLVMEDAPTPTPSITEVENSQSLQETNLIHLSPKWAFAETRIQAVVIGLGVLVLFIFGVAPQWLFPTLSRIAAAFASQTP
jgi:NADH:ubiquinone oxidoreductase subunit 2 (subunit N)